MENLNSTLYVVKREADRWVFVPSPLFAGLMIGAFGAGSAFMVYLNDIFSADGQSLRELRRDFPGRRGSGRKLGDSRLAHPPHSAQHRNRRARQLWRTGTMRCGDDVITR